MKKWMIHILLSLMVILCVIPMRAEAECTDDQHTLVLELTEAPSAAREGTLSVVCSVCGEVESTESLSVLTEGQARYQIPDGVVRIGASAFSNRSDLTAVVIPDSVTYIGSNAFIQCIRLSDITIPDGVTYIGSNAFTGCSELTSITIPDGVTNIGNATFGNCTSLSRITIPNSVTSIGNNAFFGCTGLTRITIPDSVTMIGTYAFGNCTNLASVYIKDLTAWFGITFLNGSSNPLCFGAKLYVNNKLLEDCVIPEGVTNISSYVFSDYDYLTSVSIPASVTSIGSYAFFWCDSLAQVTFVGDSYNYSSDIFYECPSLDTLFFIGNAPDYSVSTFNGVTATAYYPAENETWTEASRDRFAGDLTWVACSHDFPDLSCTSNGICTNCGAVRAVFHTFADATCTQPMTCIQCGSTSGSARGHIEITTGLREPTCTAPGLTEGIKCSVCGEVLAVQEEIPALGHDYVSGACIRCGSVRPGPAVSGIHRIAGADRIATSLQLANELKKTLGVEKFDTMIVASALNFPDALTGSYLAAVRSAPILLTYEAAHPKIQAYIEANLQSGGTVYILGGESAVSAGFQRGLTAKGISVRRLAGSDRFGTNLEIMKEAGVSADQPVLIATAVNFADSLSASAAGLPMVLVYGSLRADQKAFLETTSKNFVIIGGTSAVPASIENELKAIGSVTRLAGSSRYETSVMVAQRFVPGPDAVVLAYARNFPDGLCGGPLAYALGAPLILTDNYDPSAADAYVDGISAGIVVGGAGLISDETVSSVFDQ